MRSPSQGGTRPPWSGKSALPERWVIGAPPCPSASRRRRSFAPEQCFPAGLHACEGRSRLRRRLAGLNRIRQRQIGLATGLVAEFELRPSACPIGPAEVRIARDRLRVIGDGALEIALVAPDVAAVVIALPALRFELDHHGEVRERAVEVAGLVQRIAAIVI